VYAFSGASIEFIRRFEADYAAKAAFLTENYRSSAHIIAAANCVIGHARNRMKAGHSITIDKNRTKAPAGGDWQRLDPVGKGRVQVLPASGNPITQALAVMTELQRLATLDENWNWATTAVIAREWKYLEPVRSYCELNNIPVQMADEEAPGFWRLRETRSLVEWLGTQASKLVDTAAIKCWLDRQSTSPWWSLLREAVAEYDLETGGAELPIAHFVEWLAEWGREVRRRQTGLMLLTAHRAKGLEFDHVVVLDGGWEKVGRNEDQDAPRRLYYVAMTRAKKTLMLARLNERHALLQSLPESSSILHRGPTQLPTPAPELARNYLRLALRDVDLSFAGRYGPAHSVHRAISDLTADESLQLRREGGRLELLDEKGHVVGRLAHGFTPRAGMRCVAARVRAIVVREREDSEPEYHDRVRCERWEVVVPELVFAP
jgi:ATP-dependent DNA helicase RecQ